MNALPEVIAVAKFSHKYEMNDWKKWALKVLDRHLDKLNKIGRRFAPAKSITVSAPNCYSCWANSGPN